MSFFKNKAIISFYYSVLAYHWAQVPKAQMPPVVLAPGTRAQMTKTKMLLAPGSGINTAATLIGAKKSKIKGLLFFKLYIFSLSGMI